MKISFIIPAFNEEKFLGKCLASVFKELAKNPAISAEVIVVNNASTDNTRAIAETFVGARIIDEPKKGLIIARQAGAAAAGGDILAHIDADCILPEGWIKTALTQFDAQPDLAALSGPLVYYDLPGLLQACIKFYYYLGYLFYLLNHYVLRIGSLLQGGNFLVRRQAWENMEKAGKDFEFYGEDTILAKNLSRLGKVKFTMAMPMYSSGRRLKKEGVFMTAFRYVSNFFFVTLFKKPFTAKYHDIRN